MRVRRSFTSSIATGKIGENLVTTFFKNFGFTVVPVENAIKEQYDLLISKDEISFSAEVKYDDKSKFTGNLAFELYNTRSGKPSGIYGTKSDLWLHVLPDKTIWMMPSRMLREALDRLALSCYNGFMSGGGDDNSLMFIVKQSVILPLMQRLDTLSRDEIDAYVRTKAFRSTG